MKKALDKAAKGQQWANGQILIDNETLKPANPATTPFERLANIPVPDKIEVAVLFGANWYRNNVWHDRREIPKCKEGDQIIVFGQTSVGVGCSVCNVIGDRVIYSPLTQKVYKWGECPFTKWAYIEDLLPTEGYKEK